MKEKKRCLNYAEGILRKRKSWIRKLLWPMGFALLLVFHPSDGAVMAGEAIQPGVQEIYNNLPLYFIQNNGQLDKRVKFYERGSGHATFFTEEGIFISLYENSKHPSVGNDTSTHEAKTAFIKMTPVGADKTSEIIAEGLQDHRANYFIGNDPQKWKRDIPTYSEVIYREVYPGVDIKFYGNNRYLEYDVIVRSGADPARVRMVLEGVDSLRITDSGDMELGLEGGILLHKKPYIYQEIGGKRIEVAGKFRLFDTESIEGYQLAYGFDIGEGEYNNRYPLIIDPSLEFSTYLGGSLYDDGHGITIDGSGNVYVIGDTASTNFPTSTPLQAANGGGEDVFITKINSSGTGLVFSTYLGGSANDDGRDVVVDSSDNVYITGITESNNFPTYLPYQSAIGGKPDAFVVKINSTGSSLVYSTYLGGADIDFGKGIAVDSNGNAYVTGQTKSSNFPTYLPYSSFKGGYDAYVTKFNASGSGLVFSTYLGGGLDDDVGRSIKVDSAGNVYVTGVTSSTDFPVTPSPYRIQATNAGSEDAFVTKIASNGGSLVYSTYLGGSGKDRGMGIAIDSSGYAYITGDTASTNFPTAAPIYTANAGGSDAFVAKINTDGTALVYSTYFGGSGIDQPHGIAVDGYGNVYIAGQTASTNLPIVSPPIQGTYGGGLWDAFIASVSASGSSLAYSTYLGGSLEDQGLAIASSSTGKACVTGRTISTNFPLGTTPIQGTFAGGIWDAFVTCIGAPTPPSADLAISKTDSPDPVAVGLNVTYTLTVTNNGPSNAVDVTVTDTLPSAVTHVSSTPSQGTCSYDSTNHKVTCNIGSITSGVSATVTIVVKTSTAGMIGNTASVSGSVTDPNTSNNTTPMVTTNVGDVSRLTAVSTRSFVSTGDNVAIGGFIIGGNVSKTVLIRGRGPSMSGAPYYVQGTMSDPYLEVYSGQTKIAQNDDWQVSDPLCGTSGYICGDATKISATGLDPCQPNPGQLTSPPGCTKESSVLITLAPGPYTAMLHGVSGTGVGIVEIYDPDSSTLPKMTAISTRSLVLTGDSEMFGGFIIGAGGGNKKVLIRARGPSMSGAPYNLPGTLANPTVGLYSGQTNIAKNDDWQTTDSLCLSPAVACGGVTEITQTGMDPCQPNPGQTTAPPNCNLESAIYVTLPPGPYTTIVRGVGGGTGVGIVEIYEQGE